MSPSEAVGYEPEQRGEFLALMRDVWGTSMSEAEFDWWFDGNPAGPRLISVGDDGGRVTGALAMSSFRMVLAGERRLVVFAVHAATRAEARGQGLFQRLEQRNEAEAIEAGAVAVLGFPNPASGPILVDRVGWRDLARLRVWARPKRARRTGIGRVLPGPSDTFGTVTDELYRRLSPGWGSHIVRDAAYLIWRYTESPRPYRVFVSPAGYAVVGHAVHRGFSAGIVADLVGGPRRALLRRCVAAVDADVVIGVPNEGEAAAYLGAGFVPTRWTLRLIGKELGGAVSLPEGRPAWHFTLGDLDFF